MSRRAAGLAATLVLLGGAHAVAAAPQAFDPRSTTAAPCGTGTPAPGHASPELRPPREGFTLTVRQDKNRLCYVANGSADAPVLRVRQGDTLAVTLRNEIVDPSTIEAVTAAGKLGTPNAPVPRTPGYYTVLPGMRHPATGATNLHLHGFAVPPVAPQDDVMTVCTDPATGPPACGRRAFTYRWRIPANMPEGLYWYHPHVHGEVQAQMLMGLSGAIVVEGPLDDARHAAGIEDRVLIVRQTQDQDAGKTPAASMTAADAPVAAASAPGRPPDAIDTAHELLCTTNASIDQLSLDGAPVPVGDAPDDALARLRIAPGARQLWRVLNAATDAFLDLQLVDQDGRPLPVEVVARDGSPLAADDGTPLPTAPTTESQAVPPSGRLEILVSAPAPGTKAYLVTHAIDTGCAGDRLPERRLAVLEAAGQATPAASASMASAPAKAAEPPTAQPTGKMTGHLTEKRTGKRTGTSKPSGDFFAGILARKTDRRRVIAMAEYPRPGTDDQTDYDLFERRPGAVMKPYMMGDAPAITVRAGTTEEWVIENWTNELHTFHIHQVHFRVLEVDGQPAARPELLDVVEVPYATAGGYHSPDGPVRPGRIRVKMTFPASLAGDIPFHCHLVDHEDNGMMGVIRVLPAGR